MYVCLGLKSKYVFEWDIEGLTLSNFETLLKPKVREFVQSKVPEFQFSQKMLHRLKHFLQTPRENNFVSTGVLFPDNWDLFCKSISEQLLDDDFNNLLDARSLREECINAITERCFSKTIISRDYGGVKLISEATRFEPFGGVHYTEY